MVQKKRYFSDEDNGKGVTPLQLKRLAKAKQHGYLLNWFHDHYEDPAQETPYNSKEGGYQYIWGGPYDARDELNDEFSSFISETVIESVVEEVEADGLTDWAPGRNHIDHRNARDEYDEEIRNDGEVFADDIEKIIKNLENGFTPEYGDVTDTSGRRSINSDIENLLQALPSNFPVGIGHNNPPLDDESTPNDVITEIYDAANIVKIEISQHTPNALETARATSRLWRAAEWIGKKLDIAAEGFAKEFGGTAGKVVAGLFGLAPVLGLTNLKNLIDVAVHHASYWLHHITSFF